jgi:diadenosine tetraphosphate (Ap4A) HIT family hydrolase
MGSIPDAKAPCPLCEGDEGLVLWRDPRLRVAGLLEPDYPGFCRVIWNSHVREMADLTSPEREHLWRVLHVVETGLRDILEPDKINLASLGNAVPHLHWHVIPRWRDDRTFPKPIWASPRAPSDHAEHAADWQRRRDNATRLFAFLPQLLDTHFPW